MIHAILLALFLCSLQTAYSSAESGLSATRLLCEYQHNPLAIDTASPRLSWSLESPLRNQRQNAYRILVSPNPDLLDRDVGDLWDTGKVPSAASIQIPYNGKALDSFEQCYWKVQVWDQDDRPSPWSPIAAWRMGVIQVTDWRAKWIGEAESHSQPEPLPIFRRPFATEKAIKQAHVSISGLGFYEVRLNGNKVGESMFDPGWTNYRKTCLYATYDVTDEIQQGDNVLGVMLGNGMYNVTGGRYAKFTGSFGVPKFILQLRIEHEDGTYTEILSDQTWKYAPGPIRFTCIFGGEDNDAREEQTGWDRTGFDDRDWKSAAVCEGPGGVLASQSSPPIRVVQEFDPVTVTNPSPGVRVYDLGQNFSGIPWIQVLGPKGSQVKITPAELLSDEGRANQSASGGPHNYTYTLKGGGIETWNPRFTYYGFRYLEIEVPPQSDSPEILAVKGLFTRNSAQRLGQFECSSELYNRIHELIDWSVGSNLQSVLTDCPHREKLGWLEVAHLMAPSIMFNYDVPLFYNKVMRDIRDTQLENGLIPDIAPEYVVFQGGFRDSPEWGSAGVILPWQLYQWSGDLRALEQNYETMKQYLQYLGDRAKDHIVSHGLGDWFDYVRGGQVGESRLTPKSLTATAMYYRNTVILSKTAKVLGKDRDVESYARLAEKIRAAFNHALFDSETHRYATGSQTANAIPLVWDLVDEKEYEHVLQNLVHEVEQRDYLTSGDVGFRFLLRALAENGRSDLIYRLTHRTDEPGYGYQLQQGATSLTEAWDGRRVVSHNHCMLGHLQEWFHQELVGIRRDPADLAFKQIIIQPHPVGDITWAKGYYDSLYGRIACRWERKDQQYILDVTIPANTTAQVYVPTTNAEEILEGGQYISQVDGISFMRLQDDYAVYQVGSGTYRFDSPYEK